jgi:Fur family ferric uptake transcriptional regulator
MTHCSSLIDSLRQRGFRITPQREMIVEALAHGEAHATAEQVFNQVHQRSQAVNLATVYRTLELLVDTGLASRVVMADGQACYSTSHHGPHLHLVCRGCGDTFTADSELLDSLDRLLETKYQFRAELQHISLTGLCKHCADSMKQEA